MMSWLLRRLCPFNHRKEARADRMDARIDLHIANQEVRLGFLDMMVKDNERAATQILDRLRKDIPG